MATTAPKSADSLSADLSSVGYLAADNVALVSYLAIQLNKPILAEGPAGVGKTELAKSLAKALDRPLIRLQCYEGLDESKALYEWNYRKQLLRIQADSGQSEWNTVEDDIFSEDFLLTRPLLAAIRSKNPVVLLIDEIDKTDQEFEAMLLEILSEYQVSVPELGQITAQTQPIVVLTSNDSRELTEALKRRCLYLWFDYPDADHELQIVKQHTPDLDDSVAQKLVQLVGEIRGLDLKKAPSIAESIDWARSLLLLGANSIDQTVFHETLGTLIKHQVDLEVVAQRVGAKLERDQK